MIPSLRKGLGQKWPGRPFKCWSSAFKLMPRPNSALKTTLGLLMTVRQFLPTVSLVSRFCSANFNL